MRPAVHLGQEHDASARGVVEIRAAVRSGNGSAQRLWTLPYLARRAGRASATQMVHGRGRARARSRARRRRRGVARTRCAIRRATSAAIDRSTSTARSISSGVALSVIDADHRVIAACRDERERACRRATTVRSPDAPLAANSRFAGAEPSVGAVQIARSRSKATTSLFGEITGTSPSASRFGVPPSNGTDQICTCGATGIDTGFGGGPSQFAAVLAAAHVDDVLAVGARSTELVSS